MIDKCAKGKMMEGRMNRYSDLNAENAETNMMA